MSEHIPRLQLSTQEYVLLAGLQGGTYLLGIDDPYLGYLQEEIEATWAQLQLDLIDRGILEAMQSEMPRITPEVVRLLEPCFAPQVSFLVTTHTPDDGAHQQILHVSESGIAQQNIGRDETHEFWLLSEVAEAYQQVIESFCLENQSEISGTELCIDEAEFTKATLAALAGNTEEAIKVLKQAGCNNTCAKQLVDQITSYQVNGSIVALAWRSNSWEAADVNFLVGVERIWSIRPEADMGHHWLRLSPRSAEGARDDISRLLKRMLPGVLYNQLQ